GVPRSDVGGDHAEPGYGWTRHVFFREDALSAGARQRGSVRPLQSTTHGRKGGGQRRNSSSAMRCQFENRMTPHTTMQLIYAMKPAALPMSLARLANGRFSREISSMVHSTAEFSNSAITIRKREAIITAVETALTGRM